MDDTRKSAPWLTERLRQRVASGEWAPGTMIPGRRTLTLEYRAALSTVEKSVATLIAEGLLRADDRRGTYVSAPSAPAALASTPASRTQVYANVGLVAGLVPYDSPTVRREQWPARMLEACEHALAAEPGVSHTFINMEPEPRRSEDPDAAVLRLQADAVDAVIFIEPGAAGRRMIRAFIAAGTPVVCAALDPVQERVPHVCADDLAAGALAVQHLRSRGYQHLVYLRPFTTTWVEARLAGARTAAPHGMLTVFPASPTGEAPMDGAGQAFAGATAASALLVAGMAPGTGIIAPNDAMAAAFMQVAAKAGWADGRDYGIIGFDDRERDFGLTSLRQPLEQVGAEAAGMMLRLLRGEACPSQVALPYRLIPRTSTRP